MKRGRVRQLTDEDRILWRRVTSTVTPIVRGETESPSGLGEIRDEGYRRQEARPADGKLGEKGHAPGKQPLPPAPRPRLAIERPVRDKIARGRIPIDARIDLHGLTQHQAHVMLLNFLHRAHRHHLRHVLVITGKGSSRGSEGVLSRTVPEWLATPSFHPLVSGYSPAARHHGGNGALYVRLRRQKDGRMP